jgi:phosphohistidine phosphatase
VDVYILRHGKAEDAGPGRGDADRKLTKKGREEIALAGRWMALQELRFDLIASSPLARARETAEIVCGVLGEKDPPVTWNELAPGGSPAGVCRRIQKHGDLRAVLLVGHEPLLSTLVSVLIAGNGNAAVAMGKGALAKIRDVSCSGNPSGELHWLVTAGQMAGIK